MTDAAEIARLEELYFRVWPADEVLALNGWRLRFTRGFSRRANSVFPPGWSGTDLQTDIGDVEKIYRARGLRPAFMLNPAAMPAGLTETLTQRGYVSDGASSVRFAKAKVGAALAPGEFDVGIHPRMTQAWHDAYLVGAPNIVDQACRLSIMARIDLPTTFVTVSAEGKVCGLGQGVVVEDRVVIQGMRTLPDARGRGAATAVVGALCRWSVEQNTPDMMLQVESNNPAAQKLYSKAGFVDAYGYDYRVLDS